jgi:hypothetical protein
MTTIAASLSGVRPVEATGSARTSLSLGSGDGG